MPDWKFYNQLKNISRAEREWTFCLWWRAYRAHWSKFSFSDQGAGWLPSRLGVDRSSNVRKCYTSLSPGAFESFFSPPGKKNWKGGFISTSWPSVQIDQRSFSKTPFKPQDFKTLLCRRNLRKGAFQRRWYSDKRVISLTEFSSNTKSKMTVIVALFQIPLALSWRGLTVSVSSSNY